MAKIGKMEHSKGLGCGENLYWAAGGNCGDEKAVAAVQSWYNEIDDYNFNKGVSKNGKKIGHFTQVIYQLRWLHNIIILLLVSSTKYFFKVVWDNSTELGIGMAFADHKKYGKQVYVVGQYLSAGNYKNKYTEHVHPLK